MGDGRSTKAFLGLVEFYQDKAQKPDDVWAVQMPGGLRRRLLEAEVEESGEGFVAIPRDVFSELTALLK